MKFGLRIPSLKKRISARLSVKRFVRHSLGVKMPRGMGFLTNPKKALYNKIYNKTTVGLEDLANLGVENTNNSASKNEIPTQPVDIPQDQGRIIRSSHRALTVTSSNFFKLREDIAQLYHTRINLQKELGSAKSKLFWLSFLDIVSFIFIVGFFYKKIKISKESQGLMVKRLEAEFAEAYVKVSFSDASQLEKSWLNCIDAFAELFKSEKIWDLTYAEDTNSVKVRTIAKTSVKRTRITILQRDIEFIKSDLPCVYLYNLNGPDIFIYPTFLILFKDNQNLGIFDLKEIKVNFDFTGYLETEEVPVDTQILQQTWYKTNKDGSRDKRFNGNYQIPVVQYGQLSLLSDNGLDETYMFSNFSAFGVVSEAYKHHLSLLN